MAKLSRSTEDYLKAIYLATERGGRATGTELAARLGVSAASVTSMLQRLGRDDLVVYEPRKAVELTERGRLVALEIVRHHRLLELFLSQELGLAWDRVHEQAEILEHHLTEELEAAIAQKLGDPKFDPHGHPIPALDGTLPAVDSRPLGVLDEGEHAVVQSVYDGDSEVLRYLEKLGVLPGREVKVAVRAPFDGPLTIVNEAGERHPIAQDLARLVDVR